ncbi:MAG: hypothetical protein PHF00_03960 [Elusimicrobia bacterium]|nr:hypothetical protein [Elusimicrobiota bacterium]
MGSIGLLASDELDRRSLTLLAAEAGHAAWASATLPDAVEALRERGPKAVVVVDGPGQDAAAAVREVLRAAPLIPVVVALKRRDANRAVALLRLGAAEVVAPPWSRETLRAVLAKALRCQGTAFSVVYAPPRRVWPFYLLAVAVFFAAAFGVLALQRRERLAREALLVKSFWDLPYKHPAGLAFDGRSLWVADWFSQSLYEHAPEDISIRRIVHFTDQTPISVAFAMDAIWSATAAGRIVRHMRDRQLSAVQSYPDAAPHTAGFAYDGLYVWTSDPARRLLVKRLTDAELSPVASSRYPGGAPQALAYASGSLWSLDSVNRELVRHNLERPDEPTGRVALPEYSGGGYKPMGLAWDGTRFWTVAERIPQGSGPARLFRHADLSTMAMRR